MSKRFTVFQARARFAEALDAAEQGIPVFIERRGVSYRLTVEDKTTRRRGKTVPKIEILDPGITEGQWTWEWDGEGLSFRDTRPARG